MIRKERKGEQIESRIVQKVIDSYVEIGQEKVKHIFVAYRG